MHSDNIYNRSVIILLIYLVYTRVLYIRIYARKERQALYYWEIVVSSKFGGLRRFDAPRELSTTGSRVDGLTSPINK